MDLHQLEAFVRVVAIGNFTRAAEELSLSQPAVTRQIASLEKHFHTRLLDRLGHTVALTPAGEILHRHALEMLRLKAQTEESISLVVQGEAGTLKVGASTTAATYYLPTLLGAYRQQHPGVQLTLVTSNSNDITEMVLSNAVDVGVVMDFHGETQIVATELATYDNVLVLPPDAPLAQSQRPLSFADFVDEPLLVTHRGTRLRRIAEQLFGSAGLTPSIAMELDNLETIKQMVKAGLGIALLPRLVVEDEVSRNSLVALPLQASTEQSPQRIAAIYRRDKYLTSLLSNFLICLGEGNDATKKKY
ncbi:LysR family transcriptional regulator [bacterium]|nr:MAG: LysR family transcriptional regulator [bacterium]